jgi:hypothetical protein
VTYVLDISSSFGVYSDLSQCFVYLGILLIVEVLLSLFLATKRRADFVVVVMVSFCVLVQTLVFAINTTRNTIVSSNVNACVGMGAVFHLSVIAGIAWYAAASVNLFFVLAKNGLRKRMAFAQNKLIYTVCVVAFVSVDWLVVWGLWGSSPTLSYGVVQPWNFCWITSPAVLLGSFFVPAILVMSLNVVISVIIVFNILEVRLSTKRLSWKTLVEIVSIMVAVNAGTIAVGVLAILLLFQTDNPTPVFILITGLLLMVQALSLWLMYFSRSENMSLWGGMILGKGRPTVKRWKSSRAPSMSLRSLSFFDLPRPAPKPVDE